MKKHYYKFRDKVLSFLQQGISPEKLALGLAFGVTIGIIPLLGSTTLLCLLVAFLFRLNMPFVQIVHYLVSPFQLILYIPFLSTGAKLFSKERFSYSLEEITTMISNDLFKAIEELIYINLCGLLLWLIVTPFLFAIMYYVGLYVISNIAQKMERNKKNSASKTLEAE